MILSKEHQSFYFSIKKGFVYQNTSEGVEVILKLQKRLHYNVI